MRDYMPRRMPGTPASLVLIIIFLLAAGCTTQVAEEGPSGVKVAESQVPANRWVDYSGNWEIDHKLTESPREKLQRLYEVAVSQARQQQRQQERARRAGVAPTGQASRAINDLQGLIGLGTLAELMTRSSSLKIEQSGEYIVVQREEDFSLTCDFGESNVVRNLGVEFCGFDQDGQLLFIVQLPEGLTVRNRMVLSEDGSRLNVATTVSSSRFVQPFTVNRVYMRYEPGKGMYRCEYTLEKKKICWLGGAE